MGGALGLAITTSVLNSYVSSHLSHFLTPAQVNSLLQISAALADLKPELQLLVKSVFAEGYNIQMKILCGLAAAQIPGSLIMWQKEQIVL